MQMKRYVEREHRRNELRGHMPMLQNLPEGHGCKLERCEGCIFMVNLGEYTIHIYMDPMALWDTEDEQL